MKTPQTRSETQTQSKVMLANVKHKLLYDVRHNKLYGFESYNDLVEELFIIRDDADQRGELMAITLAPKKEIMSHVDGVTAIDTIRTQYCDEEGWIVLPALEGGDDDENR